MSYISDYPETAQVPCRPDPRKILKRLLDRRTELQDLQKEVIETSHRYLLHSRPHEETGRQIRTSIFLQVGTLIMELRLLDDEIERTRREAEEFEKNGESS